MKLWDPLTYGLRNTVKNFSSPDVEEVRQQAKDQRISLRELGYSRFSPVITGHYKIGLHIHFPEKQGWFRRSLREFNPDKLEELAHKARSRGYDIIAVSNKYNDQVFGHEPGVVFDFSEGRIVALKAQEVGHVMPFGYEGRIETGSLEQILDSTIQQGGQVLACHTANEIHHGGGEALIRENKDRIIMETLSSVNHPLLFLSFADLIQKKWSLMYDVPGVSVLDSRSLAMSGGFFVPMEYIPNLSSSSAVMESLNSLFQLRRSELQQNHELESNYIRNIEHYSFLSVFRDALSAAAISIRNLPRRILRKHFGLVDKGTGLRNFDYRGKRRSNLDIYAEDPHIYIMDGQNPAEQFIISDAGEDPNLVFFRHDGKVNVGTSFGNFQSFVEELSLDSLVESFTPSQREFFRETMSDPRFQEFQAGLHPIYPVAAVTPSGEKYMFVGKEFLTFYKKKDLGRRVGIGLYNWLVLKGEETLRMASIQNALLAEDINTIPPLYVEFSKGKGRIIYPYCQLDTLSRDYSTAPQDERREALNVAANQLARIKSRGINISDTHLGNIARITGDWFGQFDGGMVVPDVNVEGTSLMTVGDNNRSLRNPFFPSPITMFIHKAKRNQHQLIQGPGDEDYFRRSYQRELMHY